MVADMNLDGAKCVATAIGNGAIALPGDVSREADAQAMAQAALDAFGGLDVVVNNAGTTHRNGPILDVDEASFDRVYAVNVKSIFWMTRAVLPALRRQAGAARSSIYSRRPASAGGRVWSGTTARRGAVDTITQSMAQELAAENIRVNAVCPVMSATGLLTDFMGADDTPENRARFTASIQLGRMSAPADIANACVWLAEEQSSFITGVLLPVDGGRIA